MRIGLNMMFIAPGVAGGRVYCDGVLRGLASVDAQNEYVIYTRRGVTFPLPDSDRFRQVCAPVAPSSTVWRTAWEYGLLPRTARRDHCDLFHGLGNISPAVRHCPFVLTIHDVIYRSFPQSLPVGYRLFLRTFHARAAQKALRVIVPSEATAQDVINHLGVDRGRIRLVPYGPGQDFRQITDDRLIQEVLARHGVRRPYVISVARGYAHKNVDGLLRAFALLRRSGRNVQLVLVGERYRTGHDLDRLTDELGLQSAVVFTGFTSAEELSALYTGADVFAFPSLAEGFGLPILEAMACGTPVVASSASAVPEAVGSAGLLADARVPEQFADAIARVLDDADFRAELRARGLKRVSTFSWEKCAEGILAVYGELA
jgi:glycosyltransferase involved in cell wall biosynthesis